MTLTRLGASNDDSGIREVFVQCWTGHTLILWITLQTKIQTIIDKVAQKTQFRRTQICIASSGRKCFPNEDMSTQNVKHHDVFHAYLAPEHGEPRCLHQPTPLDPPWYLRPQKFKGDTKSQSRRHSSGTEDHLLANRMMQEVGHVIAEYLMPSEPTAIETITIVRLTRVARWGSTFKPHRHYQHLRPVCKSPITQKPYQPTDLARMLESNNIFLDAPDEHHCLLYWLRFLCPTSTLHKRSPTSPISPADLIREDGHQPYLRYVQITVQPNYDPLDPFAITHHT
jgi:hypothetical protein